MNGNKITARAPLAPISQDGTGRSGDAQEGAIQGTPGGSAPTGLSPGRLNASLPEISRVKSASGTTVDGSNLPENIEKLRDQIYQEGRFYQGTTRSEVEKWRNTDMDPKLKTATSMTKNVKGMPWFLKPLGMIEERRAMKRVYFTKDKRAYTTDGRQVLGAPLFASMKATPTDPAKINRSFLNLATRLKFKIRNDPTSGVGVQTKETIPQGYTLQSKDTPPTVTAASEAFREEFNASPSRVKLRIDTTITSEQAAQMLQEAQTPSTTDEFPPVRGLYAAADYRNEGKKGRS